MSSITGTLSKELWNHRRDVIISRFQTDDPKDIARDLGMDWTSVYRWARKLGIAPKGNVRRAHRNQSCNIHYFDQWSPNMAYILGYLFADGSVTEAGVTADATESDKGILEFIKAETNSVLSIKTYAGTNGTKTYCRIHLNSKVIRNKLVELGMKPSKTYLDDPYPNVPEELNGHFVRGFFDGDGSASKDGTEIKFIGTIKFIRGLIGSLVQLAGMKEAKITKFLGERATWCVVHWHHRDDIERFYRHIYPVDGYGFCLERKRARLAGRLARPYRVNCVPPAFRRKGGMAECQQIS
jgi:hypothetical protein